MIITLIFSCVHPIFAQQDKPRLAVLMTVNHAGIKAQEIEYLTALIRQNIADQISQSFLIMTQENILTLLPPDKKIEDCLQECEIEVGRSLGATIIITSSLVEFNQSYRLNLKAHETKNGILLSSKIAKGNDLTMIEEAIPQTTQALTNQLLPINQQQADHQEIKRISKQENQETAHSEDKNISSKNGILSLDLLDQEIKKSQKSLNQRMEEVKSLFDFTNNHVSKESEESKK